MSQKTKKLLWLCLTAVIVIGLLSVAAVKLKPAEEVESDLPGWTVMVYLCGTDLESNGGMATINLVEMTETIPNENVNVIIQTGGTAEWQAEEQLGLDIATDKIQRYKFDSDGFTLVDEQPLSNMANPETLSDFISWGQENYPADKYMLTIWDHGGGSLAGLIVDELHNNAIMSLDDMGRAIDQSGVHIEALMLDTCLMATIETCAAVDDSVNYLIASEETVPGQGSNYSGWLQYLYDNPDCDGARLGHCVADTIQQKYAEMGDGAADEVTFSVIDLSKMDPVYTAFDDMFAEAGTLLSDVTKFSKFALAISRSESYASSDMRDVGDLASRAAGNGISEETAKKLINAIEDAVVYQTKGSTHSYSTGMSFYYAPTDNKYYMDHYARICPSASYLAFLDATHMDWSAPESVYETATRLPDITSEDYIVKTDVNVTGDGELQLNITSASNAVSSVDANLIMLNEETGTWQLLGETYKVGIAVEDDQFVYRAKFDGTWPSLCGAPCQINIIEENMDYTLCGIPVYIDGGKYLLRAAYVFDNSLETLYEQLLEAYSEEDSGDATEEEDSAAVVNSMLDALNGNTEDGSEPYAGSYQVYGVWGGGNSALDMPGRDVISITQLEGSELHVLISDYSFRTGAEIGYRQSAGVTVSKSLTITDEPLPAGWYAYSFVVNDVLNNKNVTDVVFFYWDGENADFANSYSFVDVIDAYYSFYYADDPAEAESEMDPDLKELVISVLGELPNTDEVDSAESSSDTAA